MRLANLINEWLIENKFSHKVYYRHQFIEINNWKMDYDVLVCDCRENIEHDIVHIYNDYVELFQAWYKKKPARFICAADKNFFNQLNELLKHTCD